MLFFLFVQRLLQYEAKEGKLPGYYGEKNYLHMSFVLKYFRKKFPDVDTLSVSWLSVEKW